MLLLAKMVFPKSLKSSNSGSGVTEKLTHGLKGTESVELASGTQLHRLGISFEPIGPDGSFALRPGGFGRATSMCLVARKDASSIFPV